MRAAIIFCAAVATFFVPLRVIAQGAVEPTLIVSTKMDTPVTVLEFTDLVNPDTKISDTKSKQEREASLTNLKEEGEKVPEVESPVLILEGPDFFNILPPGPPRPDLDLAVPVGGPSFPILVSESEVPDGETPEVFPDRRPALPVLLVPGENPESRPILVSRQQPSERETSTPVPTDASLEGNTEIPSTDNTIIVFDDSEMLAPITLVDPIPLPIDSDQPRPGPRPTDRKPKLPRPTVDPDDSENNGVTDSYTSMDSSFEDNGGTPLPLFVDSVPELWDKSDRYMAMPMVENNVGPDGMMEDQPMQTTSVGNGSNKVYINAKTNSSDGSAGGGDGSAGGGDGKGVDNMSERNCGFVIIPAKVRIHFCGCDQIICPPCLPCKE